MDVRARYTSARFKVKRINTPVSYLFPISLFNDAPPPAAAAVAAAAAGAAAAAAYNSTRIQCRRAPRLIQVHEKVAAALECTRYIFIAVHSERTHVFILTCVNRMQSVAVAVDRVISGSKHGEVVPE